MTLLPIEQVLEPSVQFSFDYQHRSETFGFCFLLYDTGGS